MQGVMACAVGTTDGIGPDDGDAYVGGEDRREPRYLVPTDSNHLTFGGMSVHEAPTDNGPERPPKPLTVALGTLLRGFGQSGPD